MCSGTVSIGATELLSHGRVLPTELGTGLWEIIPHLEEGVELRFRLTKSF